MSWSARQYTTFEDERTRPVRDLLAAVPTVDVRRAVDVGCGPGNSTEVLAARFPGAAVTGFDSSADMIAAARKRMPNVQFDTIALEAWNDAGPFDVILANAVLHWLPDHDTVLPGLVAKLTPGGSLAVQMPDNLEEPAHRWMREVALDGPWAGKFTTALGARTEIKSAGAYYDLLKRSCSRVDVWRTTYHHTIAGGASGIVEWFKGSGLRPYLDALDAKERETYVARYTAAIAKAYPAAADGSALLPFPRLFIVATR
jgi:trans-aconitate 2-methyltransferase